MGRQGKLQLCGNRDREPAKDEWRAFSSHTLCPHFTQCPPAAASLPGRWCSAAAAAATAACSCSCRMLRRASASPCATSPSRPTRSPAASRPSSPSRRHGAPKRALRAARSMREATSRVSGVHQSGWESGRRVSAPLPQRSFYTTQMWGLAGILTLCVHTLCRPPTWAGLPHQLHDCELRRFASERLRHLSERRSWLVPPGHRGHVKRDQHLSVDHGVGLLGPWLLEHHLHPLRCRSVSPR